VAGIIALAPHVMVEDVPVTSIAAAAVAYDSTDLRERLARHQDDVGGAFWGWNKIWLHPVLRSWSIEEYLPRITCPMLAIQAEQDEYGSIEPIERIARFAGRAELLKLRDCRHSPHRDQPEAVFETVARWIYRLARTELPPDTAQTLWERP